MAVPKVCLKKVRVGRSQIADIPQQDTVELEIRWYARGRKHSAKTHPLTMASTGLVSLYRQEKGGVSWVNLKYEILSEAYTTPAGVPLQVKFTTFEVGKHIVD